MEKIQQKIILSTIAGVAWADGEFKSEEKAKLLEICDAIGDYKKSEIEAIIDERPEVASLKAELTKLPKYLLGSVLNFCYAMAMSDGGISTEERDYIRSIGSIYWQDEASLNLLMNWLKNVYLSEQYYFELFLLDEKSS